MDTKSETTTTTTTTTERSGDGWIVVALILLALLAFGHRHGGHVYGPVHAPRVIVAR